MGRLFDAVSALLGVCHDVSYEGEAAILLEAVSNKYPCGVYPYRIIRDSDGAWEFDLCPLFSALLASIRAGESPGVIAARFHLTIVEMTVELCLRLRNITGITTVALSGGVFQNLLLLEWLHAGLLRNGFTVYTQSLVPCNDGGLSLGQAVIAAAIYSQ